MQDARYKVQDTDTRDTGCKMQDTKSVNYTLMRGQSLGWRILVACVFYSYYRLILFQAEGGRPFSHDSEFKRNKSAYTFFYKHRTALFLFIC